MSMPSVYRRCGHLFVGVLIAAPYRDVGLSAIDVAIV